MKRVLCTLAALALVTPAIFAQEYTTLVYSTAGEEATVQFVRHQEFTVTFRVDGLLREVNANDIGVVIFDNNYTNFYGDRDRLDTADPHLIVLKRGAVIGGRLISMIPQQRATIQTARGAVTYNAVDIARVYYNPRPFFDAVEITGNNTLALPEGAAEGDDEDRADDRDRGKDRNKGKGKGKNKDRGNKEVVQRLGGGDAFIVFRNGGTTTGTVYDVQGANPELVLRDGRKFPLGQIRMINFVETRSKYAKDKPQAGWATIIMRNGAVITGRIIDYRGAGQWELADGRMIAGGQVARIYF